MMGTSERLRIELDMIIRERDMLKRKLDEYIRHHAECHVARVPPQLRQTATVSSDNSTSDSSIITDHLKVVNNNNNTSLTSMQQVKTSSAVTATLQYSGL